MNPIILQMVYYVIVGLLFFFTVGFMQRDFFYPFLSVKMSFGKFILVKVRTIHRDYCRKGRIEDGNILMFSPSRGKEVRLVIPANEKVFYRFMGVIMCDVDEEKNAFGTYDFSTVSGYDGERINDLIKRALKKPALNDPIMRIILICAIVGAIAGIVAVFISLNNSGHIGVLQNSLNAVADKLNSGTIVGGAKL